MTNNGKNSLWYSWAAVENKHACVNSPVNFIAICIHVIPETLQKSGQ